MRDAVCAVAVILFLLFVLMTVSTPPRPQVSYVGNIGAVMAVGVTVNTTSIDWGIIEPGQNATEPIEVTNTGNTPIHLSMNASGYQPSSLIDYMALSWNYGNETLLPTQSLPILFTLTIAETVWNITDFSFDITITGNPTK